MILQLERTAINLERRANELIRRCRAAGLNVTPQRLAIYRELLESEDHPSPELLFQRVKRAMPSLSVATVYKALDAFEKLGVVEQLSPLSEHKRYDANLERHHHLVCTHCKKVTDFYHRDFNALRAPRIDGFVPGTLTVQVRGLCAACASKKRR